MFSPSQLSEWMNVWLSNTAFSYILLLVSFIKFNNRKVVWWNHNSSNIKECEKTIPSNSQTLLDEWRENLCIAWYFRRYSTDEYHDLCFQVKKRAVLEPTMRRVLEGCYRLALTLDSGITANQIAESLFTDYGPALYSCVQSVRLS